MASITLQVIINDLTNEEINGYDNRFEEWLRPLMTDSPLSGHIDDISEIDREEDEADDE
jgi:hypothetical protein